MKCVLLTYEEPAKADLRRLLVVRGAEPQELSDHVLGLEILQVARAEAQPLGIDLSIVLTEQR